MSKKLHLLSAVLLMSAGMIAQTIVGTAPENKNVILEEFTGINCVFCPDGHAIANAFKATNPDNIFIINIHSGGFANPGAGQPDFRTPFGQAIADQSGLIGYPAGTINRHAFPGTGQGGGVGITAQSRGTWASTGNLWLNEPSYLNMGVEAEIDVQTNEMTVHIEGYYTGNSPESSNFLNFAVLQNNTLGPQTGGNQGSNYVHQHRLIDMPLGQWGMEISTTTATSFVDETFTYTIPADNNGVPIEISELEFVAFMTETTQEIITGIGGVPTYTNVAGNDVNLKSVSDVADTYLCDTGEITPEIVLRNDGGTTITSLDIEYSVNGGAVQTYTYTGSLSTFQEELITLDEISFTTQATNTVNISLPSDDNNANNDGDTSFDNIEVNTAGSLILEILTDDNGDEVFYNIKDNNDVIVQEGGPFDDNVTNLIPVELTTAGCYTFTIIDTAGDGGRRVRLTDLNGVSAFVSFGQYGFGASKSFVSDGILGTDDLNISEVSLFPNPASTVVNIANAANSTIEVYNMLGQVMMIKSNISANEALNVSQLVTGTYFVKISNGATTATKKFIVVR